MSLPRVKLKRLNDNGKVTCGLLVLPSNNHLFTIEPPWKNNNISVSCIPTGIYICKKDFYNDGGYWTFEVKDVEGRTHILFHIGNFINNTEGCILINDMLGANHNEIVGVSSGVAFKEFWNEMSAHEEFILEVSE